MKRLEEVKQEIQSLKKVSDTFRMSKNIKTIEFAVLEQINECSYTFEVKKGSYIQTKKYNTNRKMGMKTKYCVKIDEDTIYEIGKEDILSVS